jgi:hypothetical protein
VVFDDENNRREFGKCRLRHSVPLANGVPVTENRVA